MIPRKRHGAKNTDQGVYLGLSKTQVLSPASAGPGRCDIAPATPPAALAPNPPDSMSCRDRTQEFLSACRSLQSRQNGIQTNKPTLRAARQHSEFTLMAKHIGKDLSNTFTKLEKLTILAKRKSLFDDKAVEIEELTYIIKQDINSLNKQIAQLQDFVRAKGTQSGRHLQTHSNTIVVSLQNLKQQRSRREQFSRAPVSALPLAPNHLGGGPVVLGADSPASREVAIDMADARTSQQLQLIDEQDSYIQSRADTMQNIESTIVELGSIFQQLAHMVKEQEETIQSWLQGRTAWQRRNSSWWAEGRKAAKQQGSKQPVKSSNPLSVPCILSRLPTLRAGNTHCLNPGISPSVIPSITDPSSKRPRPSHLQRALPMTA
ncbi:syntaxin-5 isoform X2 [Heterocephalus glaber]|uniref:Syntaxin-5 isoform X2 n=1 Tax=Heterocephalus glaber TaxID=10181 RepID=A0AAX6SEG2_HETGA|nr:syntaxin-5 isoform X2 [Heterocephalus glaber]